MFNEALDHLDVVRADGIVGPNPLLESSPAAFLSAYQSLAKEAEGLGIPASAIPAVDRLSYDSLRHARDRLRGMIESFNCACI